MAEIILILYLLTVVPASAWLVFVAADQYYTEIGQAPGKVKTFQELLPPKKHWMEIADES